MKAYKTGEAAKILGVSPAKARQWLDESELTEYVESSMKRRTTRRINARGLVRIMVAKNISFDTIGSENIDVLKAIYCYKHEELKILLSKAKKRGDIFLKIKLPRVTEKVKRVVTSAERRQEKTVDIGQSSDVLLSFCKELGSLDDIQGITRNTAWAKVYAAIADLITFNTKVCLANYQKP